MLLSGFVRRAEGLACSGRRKKCQQIFWIELYGGAVMGRGRGVSSSFSCVVHGLFSSVGLEEG